MNLNFNSFFHSNSNFRSKNSLQNIFCKMATFNHNINFFCVLWWVLKTKMLRIKQILIPLTLSGHYQLKKCGPDVHISYIQTYINSVGVKQTNKRQKHPFWREFVLHMCAFTWEMPSFFLCIIVSLISCTLHSNMVHRCWCHFVEQNNVSFISNFRYMKPYI